MELNNKTQKEIQQQIFDAIKQGSSVDALKQELKDNGLHPEAYYFTTEAAHNQVMEEPKTPAGNVSGKQLIWGIVLIIILIIRIARCSSRM